MLDRTLPAYAYRTPDVYRAECEHIFRREWVLVAHVDQVPRPGDYFAFDLAGEPVVLVRGADRELRAVSNVCRHRYMTLVDPGSANTPFLTCRYHDWRYDLTGELTSAPFMADVAGFDRAAHHLPTFQVEVWQGLVFVNLDPGAEALASRLEPVKHALARYGLETGRQVGFDDRTWDCDWKVAVENASECYHHVGTHRTTFDPVYPARSTHSGAGGLGYAVHYTPASGGGIDWGLSAATIAAAGLAEADLAGLGVYTLFPSALVINAGPLVVWFAFLPCGPHRTRFLNGVLAPQALATAVDRELATKMLREINDEDTPIVEGVQRGVESVFATPGVLSHREPALADFYAYLRRTLRRGGQAPY